MTSPRVDDDDVPRTLRAGAARIDVTPGPDELPDRFLGVAELWLEVARRVEAETGIAPDRLLLFASHTHSVPDTLRPGFVTAIVASVRQAVAALRPATLAVGTGACHINVNRTFVDPDTHRWREGRNDEGPSDKTVTVLSFAGLDGRPIAVLYNHAVHAVVTGLLDLISADIPGAASAHLEGVLATVPSRCGRAAAPGTRTRSSTSRRSTSARCGSPSRRPTAWTSATRCPPAATASTAATRSCSA